MPNKWTGKRQRLTSVCTFAYLCARAIRTYFDSFLGHERKTKILNNRLAETVPEFTNVISDFRVLQVTSLKNVSLTSVTDWATKEYIPLLAG
jgi:hypothetical protein